MRRISRRALIGAGIAGLGGAGAVWAIAANQQQHGSALTAQHPTASPSPSPSPTATPVPQPVSMVITGDIMLSRMVNTLMLSSPASSLFPFEQTADFLRSFDLRVGNLECVVSQIGTPVPSKPFTFRADPLGFARLKAVGFDLVSVANNHSGDYGPDAFADMLKHLPDYQIRSVGGGLTHDEAHTPVVIERDGTRIAFVAACDIDPFSFAATTAQAGHAWLDADGLRRDIPIARALADFVIVFTHWGVEYTLDYDSQQQELAHLAIDLGADLVVGAHPHDIQPNEAYKDKLIVYSLGNFVFDEMYDSESHGNVLTLRVLKNALVEWKLAPIQIDVTTGAPRLA